jgi:hypothetical protein
MYQVGVDSLTLLCNNAVVLCLLNEIKTSIKFY